MFGGNGVTGAVLAVGYYALFLGSGMYIGRRLLCKERYSIVMQYLVGSVAGVLALQWFPLLFAFVFDTAGGVLFAKFLNLFLKNKVNPMIGAAGISAFPMSGRVVHKMGLKEDPQNFLLMHSIGVNVSGQIASVIAGGLILNFFL